MFSWFSLDIIYYPVSAIMWVWYKAFGFVLGPSNFFAWTLSVMFLVFTLRAILYKPFVKQIRTTRQMQELPAADQGAAEEVRQGPPADGAGDAEAAEGARVQPDPRLPADAGAAARCSSGCTTC